MAGPGSVINSRAIRACCFRSALGVFLWSCGAPNCLGQFILESLTNTTHPQIVDGTFTFSEEPPSFDNDSSKLQIILNHVVSVFDDAFEDPLDDPIRITWFWDTNTPFGGQSPPNLVFENDDGKITHAVVRFDPNRNWYLDSNPASDSEFVMNQKLYSFGSNTLAPFEQTAQFAILAPGDGVPAVFEAGYNGAPVTNGVADDDEDGPQLDMVTVAFQEVGHSLGMSSGYPGNLVTDMMGNPLSGSASDGLWQLDPDWVAGQQIATRILGMTTNGPFAHLSGQDAVMSFLSSDERTRPSAADFMSIAAIQGWTMLDLPRQDFLSGNTWDVAGSWMGNQIPGSADDAYIRHGGLVSFSENDTVANLVVDAASLFAINNQSRLNVSNSVRVGGTSGPVTILSINTNGEVDANLATIAEDGRINLSDSTSLLQVEDLVIDADGELRGEGFVDINDVNGMLTSDGVIRSTAGELRIDSNNNLALALRGEVFAVDGDIRFQTGFAEPMTANMTIGAGRDAVFESNATVGDGGQINLTGNVFLPADVLGSLLMLNDGAVIHANGIGNIQNTLFLNPGSMVDTEPGDQNSLVNLNGSTRFQGGQIQGDGIVRQNGDAIVSEDTLIDVNTYDMDGAAESTDITINPAATLDIDSPQLDFGGVNLFHGTINVNGGMLDVEAEWTLVGDLNLTQTDGTGAALLGDGGLLVHGSGELNVSGFAGIATDTTIAGTVFVDGEANFNARTSTLATADLETNGADDEIDFNGPVTLAGGSYTGAGVIKFDNQVTVVANTTIGMSKSDLDGDTAATVIDIRPNVTFSVASTTIDPLDDAFDAIMNLQGTFSTIVPFNLDGELNTVQSFGNPPPTLNGLTGFAVSPTGVVNTDGAAVINRDTTIQGELNVGEGITQINAATILFENSGNVSVAVNGTLELNGPTTYEGGSHTGLGLIQFNGATSINADTTISAARVDLDGAGENTFLNLNDSQLTLNVDLVETNSLQYDGIANVVGENAALNVNLSNPTLGWRLMTGGQLNFSNPSRLAPTVTMLSGSPLIADGVINAVGRIVLASDVAVRNLLNVQTGQTHVHFGGPMRSTIHAEPTATVVGLGQITVDNGTTLNLEDQSLVAVDTTNAGRLEIGFEASEVSVDYMVPAMATVRGFFAQTLPGEFAVDIGGTLHATRYDWLEVIGQARLAGTIEVTFIDGFVPQLGDVFTVLSATSGRDGEFDIVTGIDENDILGFILTDLYTANDALLRVDDVFLIGDYNDDGAVNAADYTVWRDNLGAPAGTLPNDIHDSSIGTLQYAAWRTHFGNTLPTAGSLQATVPEPATVALVAMILGVWIASTTFLQRSTP